MLIVPLKLSWRTKLVILSGVVVCCIVLVWLIHNSVKQHPVYPLQDILEKGSITVITQNNAHCYYIYKEDTMGFEYELAKMFADYLGVSLEVMVAESWQKMVSLMADNPASFTAASMAITPERQLQALFTQSYLSVRQHIIVHRSEQTIRAPEDLLGKTVHIAGEKAQLESLRQLQEQGISFEIKQHESLTDEDLLRMTADREIEVTIADSAAAMLNRRYYPEFSIRDPISDYFYIGWAANPVATDLLERMNAFISAVKRDGTLQALFDKYYGDIEDYDEYDVRVFHERLETRLPKYLSIIQDAAQTHGFDWRLIAAQMYQESHFNPKARSFANAHGLMQLTRATAKRFNVSDIYHPEQNIRAGVQFLKILYDDFQRAETEDDRLSIALAAYNVGQGHVYDAQNIAVSLEMNPHRWNSVSQALLLLSDPQYYRSALHGYCRGQEPVTYVKRVKYFYDILRMKDADK